MAYNPKRKINASDIDDLRFNLFLQMPDNNLKKLPPSKSSLRYHVLRSAFVSGWIWGSILIHDAQLPKLIDWGWKSHNDTSVPIWSTSFLCIDTVIFTCSCKDFCSRCKCFRQKVSCLPYCSCKCKSLC